MNKLKLLIAEDDKSTQALYRAGISKDAFEMRMAPDGEEALRIYNSWKPDIVALDIIMPVMAGYQFLKKIRETEPLAKKSSNNKDGQKRTVIIIVTALGLKEDIMDCLKLGINGYILKPIKYKEVSEKMFH